MHEILPTLAEWDAEGRRFAVAVLTSVLGSSPREVGAALGVREDGLMVGSVSGGCVEGVVVRTALEALASSESKHLAFGPEDTEDPWQVGLTCGGRLEVWVGPWPADIPRPSDLSASLRAAHARRDSFPVDWPGGYRFEFSPPPRLVVVGAVHIAVHLVRLATEVGFETVVVDPRCAFADPARFPTPPDRLLPEWPIQALPRLHLDDGTYAVILSHDRKIDLPAIELLLQSPVPYIGVLGGRKSQADLAERLAAAGFGPEALVRLSGPVGLPIGATTPSEIALSIMAEVVQVRREPR